MSALLSATNLRKRFPGGLVGLDGASLEVPRGKTVGLVGESGSGKTTLARALMRLLDLDDGDIGFDGISIARMDERALRPLRKRMQIVFQDPFASLDPRLTVARTLAEPLAIHDIGARDERPARIAALLARVGLTPDVAHRRPHELSGGQRQRVGIARALAVEPELLVLDEPVSALDASVQAQILNLLCDLQVQLGLTLLFISHDLRVIEYMSDEIAVMHAGRVVEHAPASDVLGKPRHPYTQSLLASVPRVHAARSTA